MPENVACIVPKHNYCGVFFQMKLLNRGPEPAAACLRMSRALPIALAGYRQPTRELICVVEKNVSPLRRPSVSSSD